jgi:hypothetical protein
MATHLTLVEPGDVVIGVSVSHSHPSVVRAAGHVGVQFIDTAGVGAFRDVTATQRSVALVVLTAARRQCNVGSHGGSTSACSGGRGWIKIEEWTRHLPEHAAWAHSRAVALPPEPKVCRLPAGGKWIRTLGSGHGEHYRFAACPAGLLPLKLRLGSPSQAAVLAAADCMSIAAAPALMRGISSRPNSAASAIGSKPRIRNEDTPRR